MTPSDTAILALMRLTPEERTGVLELLPEWQRLTRLNDLRSTIQAEVVDAIIYIAKGASQGGTGNVWQDLTNTARRYSAKIRVAKLTPENRKQR